VRLNLAPLENLRLRQIVELFLHMQPNAPNRLCVYGDIPVGEARSARESAKIPEHVAIAALAHSRWWLLFIPVDSFYAFTEQGIYASKPEAFFTPYRDFAHLDLDNVKATEMFLRERGITFDLDFVRAALAKILQLPETME
jgi:hypothetical protein